MRQVLSLAIFLGLCSLSFKKLPAQTKPATGPSEIKIGGAVKTPFTVTIEDLKAMPRRTVSVGDAHGQKADIYEGVPLAALLQKAGVPQGAQLHGNDLATYILVDAADDYRVVFSLAELDSSFVDSEVILADTINGAALAPSLGPFRLIVPHDKRPGRWVDMVRSITVGKPN